MKKIIVILISIVFCSCATSQYSKQLIVDLNSEQNLMIEFVDADSNGVFDYMNSDITYKNGSSYYKCKTSNIIYDINKDSTELTAKDITKYLRDQVYYATDEGHGMFAETFPPLFQGTVAISHNKRPAMNFCDILIKDDTLVTIVCPSKTDCFHLDAREDNGQGFFKTLEEKTGKSIFDMTEEDLSINIRISEDKRSIILSVGEVIARCCEWVELYDFNAEKKFSEKMNNQRTMMIPTESFENGTYILRLIGYDFVDYQIEDRVVIFTR